METTHAAPKRRRRRRLRTITDAIRLVADVLRGLDDGTADPARARTTLYGCQVMGTLIEKAETEQLAAKMNEIEERLGLRATSGETAQ